VSDIEEDLPDGVRRLHLDRCLKQLGSPALCELVGEARLEAINDVLSGGINEARLTQILRTRYGTQILARPEIRSALVRVLDDRTLQFIATGEMDGSGPVDRAAVTGKPWSREDPVSQRYLAVFGLDETYLPPVSHHVPSSVDVDPGVQLFAYQLRLKDAFVRFVVSNGRRVLLHMPTGAGKTRSCIEGLSDLWRSYFDRTGCLVWLAHSEELCEQAIETFEFVWAQRGDGPVSLRRLWGSHNIAENEVGSSFIVASLQKVHSLRRSSRDDAFRAAMRIRNTCQLVVIDEAHKAIAPTYKESIEFISGEATRVVGLTATPGRGVDQFENRELAAFFNSQKIGITGPEGRPIEDPLKMLQDEGFLSRIRRKVVPTDVTLDLTEKELEYVATFLDVPSSVLFKLGQDAGRNACILGEIASLVEQNKDVLVFACSVDHAHLLSEMLLLRDVDSRCIDGSTPKHERSRCINAYREGAVQVLVNYGVLTTGFDAPNTSAIVIARPTASLVLYSQMVGRGIRGPRVGGNAECLLVDLKDNISGFPDERQAFTYFDEAWR